MKLKTVSQLSNNNLQSIDYAYNIRGWMTHINRDQMSVPDLGGKLFAYRIRYNEKEGITNPDAALFSGKDVLARYNGNIAEVDWRSVENIGNSPSLTPKRYGYAYDHLNRLRAGYYQNPQNPGSKENTESIDYDLNGNITNLYRSSVIESGNTATVIDRLEYFYASGNKSNTLDHITDHQNNPSGYEGGSGVIHHDSNGNMDKMQDKNIESIAYNYLNLPHRIVYGGGFKIESKYNASGIKLQKKVPRTECGIMNCTFFMDTTDYLDGFQYLTTTSTTSGGGGGGSESESMMMAAESARAFEIQAYSLDNGSSTSLNPATLKDPNLQFFPTEEGFYDYKKDQYIYQYRDYLGNTRLSFARNSAGALEIVDANDYYPFGMNHLKSGNSFFGMSSFKSYKFLGNELQETGFYDMNTRLYMSDLGRFNTHDPMSDVTLDPYSYAYNNPITFSDPTGLFGEPIPKLSPNAVGGDNNPALIEEVIIGKPIHAIKSNPATFIPYSCTVCYSGTGMTSGITLPPAPNTRIPSGFYKPALYNGSAKMLGGIGDFFGILDIVNAVAENNLSADDQQKFVTATLLAAVILRKPGLAVKEADGAFYSIAYEMKLAEESYPGVTRYMHFKEANIALESEMLSNPTLRELGIIIPRSKAGSIIGKSPTNWVWHHEVEKGVMQLVPKSQHPNVPGGIFWETLHPGKKGGFSIWGKK